MDGVLGRGRVKKFANGISGCKLRLRGKGKNGENENAKDVIECMMRKILRC